MEVPVYERRRVLPDPVTARVPDRAPAMGTEALAQGLSSATGTLANVQAKEGARLARAELASLEVKLNEAELRLIHDPQTGARSRKGRDALGLADQYLPQFDAEAKALRDSVANPMVRQGFEELIAGRRTRLAEGLATYSAGEAEKYYDTESKAQLESFVNLAVANAGDAKAVDEALGRVRWHIGEWAASKGLGDEARKLAIADAESKVYRGQIEALVASGRYTQASEVFTRVGSGMTATDRAAVDGAVRTGMVRSESRRLADEIIGRGGGVTAWRSAVKGIEDPDVRAQVKDYVDEEWSDREAVRQQAERDAVNAAGDFIDRGEEVPANVWAAVPGSSKNALRNVERARKRGEDIATEPEAYEEIYRGLMSTDPKVRAEWINKPLRQYWDRLDATDREFFTKLQVAQGNPGSPENRKLLAGTLTRERIVSDALTGLRMGAEDARTSRTKREEAGRFRREVDRRVVDLQVQMGREATTEEVQRIVDDMAITVTIPGTWTDDEKPLYQLEVGDVPDGERRKIEDSLQAAGRAVTDDNVLAVYAESRKAAAAQALMR